MTKIDVYDMPINEVVKILDKSDRQVRRYVKEKSLRAKPVRIDGHIKLMFSRDEVIAFSERFSRESVSDDSGTEIVIDAQLIGNNGNGAKELKEITVIDTLDIDEGNAVRYAIDALKEQISDLKQENKDLHYQLEQRSGQVGFLQGKIEALQDEVKALMPAPKPEHTPWYRRLFGRGAIPTASSK